MADEKLTSEESSRRISPQFNPFRSWVVKELNRRKFEHPPQPIAPFVRLTSCQSDAIKNYAYFSLGLHGFEPSRDLNIFDVSYGSKDVVGYAVDLNKKLNNGNYAKRLISADDLTEGAIPPAVAEHLSKDAKADEVKFTQKIKSDNKLNMIGTSPTPGITNISVVRRDLGAPLSVDVTYVCYNRSQLEFLRNHFMTAGRFVVVEWGNEFSDQRLSKTLNFASYPTITDTLTTALKRGRKYVIDQWVRPNNGNYDFIIGTIGNFRIGFDANTNIYTCTTTVYSMGENMWGFDLHKTIVRKETDSGTNDVSSFGDFFKVGSKFDKLLENGVGDNSLVAFNQEVWDKYGKNVAEEKEQLKDIRTNPQDYRFVSWKFFARNVMYHLFDSLKSDAVKADMMAYLKFYDDTTDTDPEQETWVCDNQFLRSTDPETMVLVKKDMKSIPAGFAGNGYFDEFAQGNDWRGKLTRGVWLNAGMIRECFLSTNTFADAMREMLKRMNQATGDFWKLRMFYDEDEAVYRIIDDGCVNNNADILPPFYKFNVGGIGECLGVDFDSAFPPELVTQMALYAQFKTAKQPDQEALLNKYPSLGTTSTFMYSLNWTNLQDEVERSYRGSLVSLPASDTFQDVTMAPAPGHTDQGLRTTTRVTGAKFTNGTVGGATAASPNGSPPNTKVSTTAFVLPVDTTVQIPRNPVGNAPIAGTISYRNNNPGNLEYLPYFATNYGAVPGDPERFCQFKTPEIGFAALCKQVEIYKERNYTARETVYRYAPPNENNSALYLQQFCNYLNCGPDTRIVGLDTVTVARFIAKKESSTSFTNGPPIVKNTVPAQANPAQTPAPTDPTPLNKSTGLADEQVQKEAEAKKAADAIKARFGDNFINMIEMAASSMRNRITRDGYLKYKDKKPNPFVCPFPTTASVTITIQGISGLSVSDGFYVERLPFVFEQYGVFRITTINERITKQGWVTEIRGYFSMLFLNGEGLKHSGKTPALSHTPVNG